MSHTPKEAKQRLCPTRLGLCEAEQCMGWRWVAPVTVEGVELDATGLETRPYAFSGPSKTHGYCGLAGRPEVAP